MAATDGFPLGVADKLGWYVYRLTDPRRGDETFYVGKGRGDRIFAHVRGDYSEITDEDTSDLKALRIKEIHDAGLEVGHVVHRHGIEDERAAYEIEAAVMDAYPQLTNKAGGHGSGERGPRTVETIILQYASEPFRAEEEILLVSINRTISDDADGMYEAARFAWNVSRAGAERCTLVLAQVGGVVVGAFRPHTWLEATVENFPDREPVPPRPPRRGFVGERADDETQDRYVGKLVPDKYRTPARRRRAWNYVHPD